MAENSGISWTTDTFNPWEGCQKVGPGCDGCYAEARNIRYAEKGATVAPNWGPGAPRRRTSAANWRKPLKWNREQAEAVAADPATPPRFVFCASLADVFDNAVDIEWRADLFALIRETPHLTWLLLTKRPGLIVRLVREAGAEAAFPRNAALGCTIVNQEEADRDIPKLLQAKRTLHPAFAFLSMEPLLGPTAVGAYLRSIDWVITGGETSQGHHEARPADPAWFRQIRDDCAAAGVPYHHKQNGEWAGADVVMASCEGRRIDGISDPATGTYRIGKARAGRLLDGVEHNARPEIANG